MITASAMVWFQASPDITQVRSKEDVLTCARHIHTDSLAPVFLTSSVTGDGLELVKLFFNLLPQRHKWADRVRSRHLSVSAADYCSTSALL